MKKANSIIITIIIATLVISMFAFQPTTTEASSKATPSVTPTPRKAKRLGGKTAKISPKKHSGFTEVTGLDIQTERRKSPRKKAAQYNPKKPGVTKIKAKKPTRITYTDDWENPVLRGKHPRRKKLNN